MLSISTPIKGAACIAYYLNMSREDYYLKGSEGEGRWFGWGADSIGLSGEVEKDALHWLLLGYLPDGSQQLVQNAGSPNRAAAWDLTFSAPKSVSVLWGLAPEAVRREIEQAQQKAVEFAIRYLEEGAISTRRGKEGKAEEPAAAAFALIEHGSSRDQDPQLHTHAILLNLALRKDGSTGTLKTRNVFRLKMAVGAIYQAHLAEELRQRLDVEITLDRVGFQIKGVPPDLCRDLSKRRQAIEKQMLKLGLKGALAAKLAALTTRPEKPFIPREELVAKWHKEAKAFGWNAQEFLKTVKHNHSRPPSENAIMEELSLKIATAPKEQRTPTRLIMWAMRAAIRHGADVEMGLRALDKALPRADQRLRVDWHRLFNPTPWEPSHHRLIRVDWKSPFPNAWWKGARNLKLPVIAVELPKIVFKRRKPFQTRWGDIRKARNTILGQLRLQDQVLCPKAPKWSSLHGKSFPAFRFRLGKSELPPLKQWTEKQQQGH